MPRSYSLAYLTAPDQPPPAAISMAAELGYRNIGVRMLPAAPGGHCWPLLDDAAMLRDTVARIKDRGVGVFDVEIIWLQPDFNAADYGKFLDVCASLGAQAILVAGVDPDLPRMTQTYAAFCAAAKPFGLTADLEFMPWTTIPDAKTALSIAAAAAQSNGGVLVDALHFARSGSTLDDVRAIPRSMIHYTQICDAPAGRPATTEGLLHTARRERLLPGDGGIDLAGLFAALPDDVPVSIELPSETNIHALGSREWARRALAASKVVLEGTKA